MRHLAVIPDGNRRWAKLRGLEPGMEHVYGTATIELILEWAIDNGLNFVTIYGLSSDNMNRRSLGEIDDIFETARLYFLKREDWYCEHRIRVQFSGRRDRLPKDILEMIDHVEKATAKDPVITLTLLVDYDGQAEVVAAINAGARTVTDISAAILGGAPNPDLIIRTGGYQRLSKFMLWSSGYSELYFLETLFPDLTAVDLDTALEWFKNQNRHFGS